MSKLKAAYIAGLIDGEGYVSILVTGNKKGFTPVVKIAMTDEAIIRWLYDSFGGYYETRSRSKIGEENWKESYCWSLKGARSVKPFIDCVKPYLRVKNAQADVVSEFCSLVRKKSHGGEKGRNGGVPLSEKEKERRLYLYRKIRELNHRGILHRERLSGLAPLIEG